MANNNPISDKELYKAILEDRDDGELIDEACYRRLEQLAEDNGDEKASDLIAKLRKLLCSD